MTGILSWNIQNGMGCDGGISLTKIADVIFNMGTPDIICLQEVSRGLILDDSGRPADQIAGLAGLFQGYELIFGVAVDAADPAGGKRWQFGNVVLSRLPLLSVALHPLPRPAVQGTRCMTRQATEVAVSCPSGPLRVINTHLEYHSRTQKLARIERLREIQREALEEQGRPRRVEETGPYQFVARPVEAVLCGDFNILHGSEEYDNLLEPLAGTKQRFHDAWNIARPNCMHEPTCGVHDRRLWPQGPHCRDFFFVAGACVDRVRAVRIDAATDASDHQPLLLEMADDSPAID